MTGHKQAGVGFFAPKLLDFRQLWSERSVTMMISTEVVCLQKPYFSRCQMGIASNVNYCLSPSSVKFMLDFQHRLQPLTQVNGTLNCFIKWGWN